MSAIWHGFYPGFYSFFIGAGLLDYQAKLFGQVLGPHIEGKLPGSVEYFLSWLWCYAFCAYFSISFILLSFENFYKVYDSMYFIGHIILLSSIILLKCVGGKGKKRELDDKKKTVKTD